MDIYEFAMQMEQDGEDFYRDLARHSTNKGVKRILTMLADDEAGHYDVVHQMREAAQPQMRETTILSSARNVFAQMQEQDFELEGMQVDLFRKAQDIERKSQDFYQQKAEAVSEPAHKEILLTLADEEKRHYFLLDHMIEFLSRPQTWIEDAEFHHLDEY